MATIEIRPHGRPRDPVGDLLDTNDPADFFARLRGLATRSAYAAAVAALEEATLPDLPISQCILVSALSDQFLSDTMRAFRVARILRVITEADTLKVTFGSRRRVEGFTFADLADATRHPKKSATAWVALHILGFVRAADGVGVVDTRAADAPGVYPTHKRERAGLALGFLIRLAFGEVVAPRLTVRP